jgi:hypothetical protein
MHTWAVLAAKEAAIASGLGAGIVPAVGAGSLDGFALGALMSGTCILMLTSPRRGRRHGLAAAREQHHPVMAEAPGDVAAGHQAPVTAPAPPPDENGAEAEDREDLAGGYRSRHSLADQGGGSKRSGTRRNPPRHAAPPASFSGRMTGRTAVRALAGGARS